MKKAIISVIILFLLITGFSSIVVTYDNEYKLIRQFGKIDRVISESGISFKIPFIEAVDTVPRNILLYDLPSSEVITKDKKTMVADTYALWKITDPLKFAKTLSNSTSNAESRINTSIYNSLKTVIGSMTQAEVISARDGDLGETIMESINNSMKSYGIELVSVETKRLDLPSDNKTAVYERMISEREQMAAQYKAEGDSKSQIIKNQTDKEVSIMLSEAEATAEATIAEGEAEYMKTLSKAYASKEKSEFYSFVRSLDAAKASLTGDNNTLILSEDSPIAQIFLGK
ncbi:MAG: protease modulator HflC [Lachnospiraceae bacterium]|nr:protease modulator HflC [Lachnospiraceae bacterium]